ncbi:MAG: sulfurtransferase TusA family protein [Asticcacaulis sp.]|nr:sulfurtransferase TusA family protein [Asticcacaulis sp.]
MSLLIDARGHRCPVPTLKLRRALETAVAVTLLADDAMAQIDVPHFCSQNNHVLERAEAADGHWIFEVRAVRAE